MSTLQALHDLLLDRSKWPDDFEWDYADCQTCAIGLACRTGLIDVRPNDAKAWHFGIDYHTYQEVFFYIRDTHSYGDVTPEVVAERIANIL